MPHHAIIAIEALLINLLLDLWMYVLLTADVEKIDPPLMEGLDSLIAVSECLL